jgi:hypothetical protein
MIRNQLPKMLRLLVKRHNQTGLKYLCKTERDDWVNYPGSGKVWQRHLRKHGFDFSTLLLFETDDMDSFQEMGITYSNAFDIVKSKEWANLCNEDGGGCRLGKSYEEMWGLEKAEKEKEKRRAQFLNSNPNANGSSMRGKKQSKKQKLTVSQMFKGKTKTLEHRKNLSLSHIGNIPGNKGMKWPKVECPHCHKMVGSNNPNQYHYDNCKAKM